MNELHQDNLVCDGSAAARPRRTGTLTTKPVGAPAVPLQGDLQVERRGRHGGLQPPALQGERAPGPRRRHQVRAVRGRQQARAGRVHVQDLHERQQHHLDAQHVRGLAAGVAAHPGPGARVRVGRAHHAQEGGRCGLRAPALDPVHPELHAQGATRAARHARGQRALRAARVHDQHLPRLCGPRAREPHAAREQAGQRDQRAPVSKRGEQRYQSATRSTKYCSTSIAALLPVYDVATRAQTILLFPVNASRSETLVGSAGATCPAPSPSTRPPGFYRVVHVGSDDGIWCDPHGPDRSTEKIGATRGRCCDWSKLDPHPRQAAAPSPPAQRHGRPREDASALREAPGQHHQARPRLSAPEGGEGLQRRPRAHGLLPVRAGGFVRDPDPAHGAARPLGAYVPNDLPVHPSTPFVWSDDGAICPPARP
ncbi:hypothetical protein ON010_g5125 [Phytophthora cinnamomi]|nr:hypothetical protein ON010_g5125 [Phytophthora cinnamomi]